MKKSTRALIATLAGFAALGFGGIALFYWAAFQSLTLDFGSMDLTLRILIIAAIVSFAVFVLAAPESVGEAAGKRSTRLTTNALVASVAAIAIAVVINFISENAPTVRADWTAGGDFSLSPQTQSVLESLNNRPGNVQAVAFLRQENQGGRQQAEDLLREYSSRNRKLTYQIIDPFRQPAAAIGYGITREGVVVFTDGQKREIADSITERDFTSAIVRLGQNKVNTIAFLTGHGERDINSFEPGVGAEQLPDGGLEPRHVAHAHRAGCDGAGYRRAARGLDRSGDTNDTGLPRCRRTPAGHDGPRDAGGSAEAFARSDHALWA
jgi:hypothetical protein